MYLNYKKVLKILKISHVLDHCKPIFKFFNTLTVSSLFFLESVLFVHENNFNLPFTDVHIHNTRDTMWPSFLELSTL